MMIKFLKNTAYLALLSGPLGAMEMVLREEKGGLNPHAVAAHGALPQNYTSGVIRTPLRSPARALRDSTASVAESSQEDDIFYEAQTHLVAEDPAAPALNLQGNSQRPEFLAAAVQGNDVYLDQRPLSVAELGEVLPFLSEFRRVFLKVGPCVCEDLRPLGSLTSLVKLDLDQSLSAREFEAFWELLETQDHFTSLEKLDLSGPELSPHVSLPSLKPEHLPHLQAFTLKGRNLINKIAVLTTFGRPVYPSEQDSEGLALLGLMNQTGFKTPRHLESALEWYLRAGEHESSVGYLLMAKAYENERDAPITISTAHLKRILHKNGAQDYYREIYVRVEQSPSHEMHPISNFLHIIYQEAALLGARSLSNSRPYFEGLWANARSSEAGVRQQAAESAARGGCIEAIRALGDQEGVCVAEIWKNMDLGFEYQRAGNTNFAKNSYQQAISGCREFDHYVPEGPKREAFVQLLRNSAVTDEDLNSVHLAASEMLRIVMLFTPERVFNREIASSRLPETYIEDLRTERQNVAVLLSTLN